MFQLGDKVRLRTSEVKVGTRQLSVDTNRVYTITNIANYGDSPQSPYLISCSPHRTGIHRVPESEFELVESSNTSPTFAIKDAVVIQPSAVFQTINKTNQLRIDRTTITTETEALVIGINFKWSDWSVIEYLVHIPHRGIGIVQGSDLTRKDYSLF